MAAVVGTDDDGGDVAAAVVGDANDDAAAADYAAGRYDAGDVGCDAVAAVAAVVGNCNG